MKKLFLKIRKKRLKGNISLLIIIVLLASSVIALLSINQIQRLLSYGNMTFNYFRSFYLAKAWTELWLAEIYYSEAGFKHTINSWDAIVTWNLVWNYTWFNPYFTMSITWSFAYITNDIRFSNGCSGDNKIILYSWDWIVLPLFKDDTVWLISNILTWHSNPISLNESFIEDIQFTELTPADPPELTFWLFSYENDSMEDFVVKTWTNLTYFLQNNIENIHTDGSKKNYLTIMNYNDESVSFCIQNSSNNLIPYSDFLLTVHANYWDMEVWIQSVIKKEVPWWFMNVLWLN